MASDVNATTAASYMGYWRVGGFIHSTPVGTYDDFIVYNRVLSPGEIQKLSQ